MFLATVFGVMVVVHQRLRMPLPRWAALERPYAIGGVAIVWVMRRIAEF